MAEINERKSQANKQAEMVKDYQRTFESEPGKKVLQDLFRRFGYRVTPAQGDPYATYFALGQQALMFHIIEMLKIDSNQLLERIRAMQDQQNTEE